MKKIFLFLLFFPPLLISQIAFDMNIESGNLNQVTTSDSVNYSVTTISDIGGRWFYFRISGVQDKYIRVDVTTSDVNRPLYSYDNITFQRFTQAEAPQINRFQKQFEQDTVFVAYYVPYTFSHLMDKIGEWKTNEHVIVDTIGYSPKDLPMQEMIVTDSSMPDSLKRRVWIHARTHPGETPSSFHFEGIVEELLSGSAVTENYLKNVVFHLIPFVNPDGVFYGRSRTNFDNVDLERDWNKSPAQTTMEVNALKTRMTEINDEKVFSVFLNLHSQASSNCTFFIHTASSTSDYFYRRQYQFAYLNSSDNPYFVPNDFSESNLQSHFPEGWLWSNHGDEVLALTYETPYDQYSSDDWVTNENLRYIGARTLHAVAEFMGISHPERFVLDNDSATVSGNSTVTDAGLTFYGDDYIELPAGEGGEVLFESDEIPAGKYSVFAWWKEDNSNSYDTKFVFNHDGTPDTLSKTQKINGGQWNYLADINHTTEGPMQIKMLQSPNGKVAADAFRIIFDSPITSVKSKNDNVPVGYKLEQNYPNPFNPSTTIRFELPESSDVRLEVYNALGELVEVLAEGTLGSGTHEYIFNSAGKGLASGVYYYSLTTKDQSLAKGMVLVK